MTWNDIQMMVVEHPLLKAQVEALKSKNGGALFRINEYASAIKEIAEENAKLKFIVSDLEEENNLLKHKLGMKVANDYCLTLLGGKADNI